MKIEQLNYQSSTMGNIPLSFTGKHLLQELREAVTDFKDGKTGWETISRVRGKLALYMSTLERMQNDLRSIENWKLAQELAERLSPIQFGCENAKQATSSHDMCLEEKKR